MVEQTNENPSGRGLLESEKRLRELMKKLKEGAELPELSTEEIVSEARQILAKDLETVRRRVPQDEEGPDVKITV